MTVAAQGLLTAGADAPAGSLARATERLVPHPPRVAMAADRTAARRAMDDERTMGNDRRTS